MVEKIRKEILIGGFRTMLETAHDMQFYKNTDLVYVTCSKPFANMVGKENIDEIVGCTDYDLFDSKLAKKYIKDDREVLNSGQPIIDLIECLPEFEGKKRYCSTSKYIIYNDRGETIGLYGKTVDVTSKIELAEEKESTRMTNKQYISVIEADLTENRLLSCESEVDLYGNEYLSKNKITYTDYLEVSVMKFIARGYEQEFLNKLSLSNLIFDFDNGLNSLNFRTRINVKDKLLWADVRVEMYFSKVSNTLRVKELIKDTNEFVEREMELKIKSEQDSLTGLFNRSGVFGRIINCLNGYGEKGQHALLFIDIDNFKQLNDNFGHHFGDIVLKDIATLLVSVCADNSIVGRVGGDEFVVLLQNAKKGHAGAVMKKICAEIMRYSKSKGKNSISCSIGCSLYASGDKSFGDMYNESDNAMYLSKENGKNTYGFFVK